MRSLFFGWLTLFVVHSAAATPLPLPADKLIELAASPGWHALLHYDAHWLGVRSEVNDEWFFLGENGRHDPLAELKANLAALQDTHSGDAHFACRFPARAEWLTQQLQLDRSMLPKPKCEAFESYRRAMNASSVTLVYPVAYLNNPQSMFGHTFLLFNQAGETELTKAKSYTLNYAGKVGEEDSTPKLVLDGLFGGYKGVFNILPYEARIKDYRDVESRGLWEYKLNLTQAETDQLLRHSWEIHKTHFDYYFLKTNCSYRLLGLLDVARPGMNLEKQLKVYAIPVDTVRLVLAQGLVDDTRFQPAGLDYIYNDWSQLSEPAREFVLNWLEIPPHGSVSELMADYQRLTASEKFYVQDLLTRYGPLKATVENRQVEFAALPDPLPQLQATPLTPPPPPRDDEAHGSALVSLAAGRSGEDIRFQEFTWRPAFHSLTDPSPGFVPGTQIKVLETVLRRYQYDEPDAVLDDPTLVPRDSEVQVERLDIFDIYALFPRDALFKPTSWQFGIGAYRAAVRGEEERPMLAYSQYRLGVSYKVASVVLYGLAGGRLVGSTALEKGFDAGINLELGAVKTFSLSQWAVTAEQTDFQAGEAKERHTRVRLINSWNLGKNAALELSAARTRELDEWITEPKLGVNLYF